MSKSLWIPLVVAVLIAFAFLGEWVRQMEFERQRALLDCEYKYRTDASVPDTRAFCEAKLPR